MKTVPFAPEDLEAMLPLQPEGWPNIRDEFRGYLGKNFCFPIKAVHERRMTGVGVLIHFGKTAWLAHIIVDPEKRNNGIGRLIVKRLLDLAKKKGSHSISLVATDLGYPVYQKAGFGVQTRYLFFKRESKERTTWELSPHVRPARTGDEEKILRLDRQISGEDRAALIRPFFHDAWVCEENGSVQGYYLPGLGEGMILAENERAGMLLMGHKHQAIDTAVLPADNQTCIRVLKENGFKQHATARRMLYGAAFDFYPEKIYSRIAGNFG